MMQYNLFALTDDPNNRRVRFVLSQEVQTDLTSYLSQQKTSFLGSGQAEIPFDGKYKPEAGEILVINDFDDINELADAIANPLAIPEVDPTPQTFETICALFSGEQDQDGSITVLVQHFDKRKIISTNGLSIFHAANVYKKVEGIGLTVDSRITAILKGNTLKFHSFHHTRQIFDLSDYYKEATVSDINDFAALECISVPDLPNLINISDTWVRRKLWLIQQSQILQKYPMHQIKTVAMEFNVQLKTISEDGVEKIVVPQDKATFKSILRFLDEDYYKSPLSNTKYITNSKRLVPAANPAQ
jgi:hypothetical protein